MHRDGGILILPTICPLPPAGFSTSTGQVTADAFAVLDLALLAVINPCRRLLGARRRWRPLLCGRQRGGAGRVEYLNEKHIPYLTSADSSIVGLEIASVSSGKATEKSPDITISAGRHGMPFDQPQIAFGDCGAGSSAWRIRSDPDERAGAKWGISLSISPAPPPIFVAAISASSMSLGGCGIADPFPARRFLAQLLDQAGKACNPRPSAPTP